MLLKISNHRRLKVAAGDVILGSLAKRYPLNGYSLFVVSFADCEEVLPELEGKKLKDVLLGTNSYLRQHALPLIKEELVNGTAYHRWWFHRKCTTYVLRCMAELTKAVPVLPIFKVLKNMANTKKCLKSSTWGIGLMLAVKPENKELLTNLFMKSVHRRKMAQVWWLNNG